MALVDEIAEHIREETLDEEAGEEVEIGTKVKVGEASIKIIQAHRIVERPEGVPIQGRLATEVTLLLRLLDFLQNLSHGTS